MMATVFWYKPFLYKSFLKTESQLILIRAVKPYKKLKTL